MWMTAGTVWAPWVPPPVALTTTEREERVEITGTGQIDLIRVPVKPANIDLRKTMTQRMTMMEGALAADPIVQKAQKALKVRKENRIT